MAYPDEAFRSNGSPYSLNLGQIQAGDWTSTVASRATLGVRLGFPRVWTVDQAEVECRAAIADIARADPDFLSQPVVTLSGFRAEGYLLGREVALARDLAAAHRDAHAAEPETYAIGSTTDARTYINSFGIPAICFGATGHDLHGIDESVELQSIIDAARTLARFILMRFSGGTMIR
jgi:acetylornithine deacetylase